MLIAHLPSGYILGRLARRRWREPPGIMIAAITGAIIPDIDMLYFHLVDGGRIHHHAYITHWPLFWALTGLVSPMLVSWRVKPYLAATGAFFGGAMSHMILDTVASPLLWLMPFSNQAVELVTVPATHKNWVLSFVLHWTFAVELLICGFALWLRYEESQTRDG